MLWILPRNLFLHPLPKMEFYVFCSLQISGNRSILFCAGVFCIGKKKETATAILGEISLKDAKIEKVPKTNFVIKITKDDKSWQISTEKEIVCDEWINELIQNTQKPPSSAPLTPTGRKETRMLRAQKKSRRIHSNIHCWKKNHTRSPRYWGL